MQRHTREEALGNAERQLEVVEGESGAHAQHGQAQRPDGQLALQGGMYGSNLMLQNQSWQGTTLIDSLAAT